MKREVCCGNIEDVRRATESKADRVELCEDLSVGGVTPSHELIEQAIKIGIPVNVLIRPRGGDFVYNEDEVQQMIQDIEFCKDAGANAVVIGALTKDGDIDIKTCERLMDAARPLEVTFHRAFDECCDAMKALELIIALGCSRILTSGQAPTAPEGTDMLRNLVEKANGRIIILAGSGVTPNNYEKLMAETGVTEVHGTKMSLIKN